MRQWHELAQHPAVQVLDHNSDLGDSPADGRVLDGGEGTSQHPGHQRRDQRGAPRGQLNVVVAGGVGSSVERMVGQSRFSTELTSVCERLTAFSRSVSTK